MRILSLLLWLMVVPASATENVSGLADAEKQERFRELTWVLRCPKCQNQNIADSNAEVAEDLRNEITRMLNEDRSDSEIIDFMVQRYGEFVLYQPRATGANLLLWVLPVAGLVLGLLVVVVRARQRAADATLSEDEARRLDSLLDEEGKGS